MKPLTSMAAMQESEWLKLAVNVVTGIGGAVVGLFVGVWKWGRKSAQDEQAVKDGYEAEIADLRKEVRAEMAAHIQKADAGNDLLVAQFKESFEGLRRQHDDHKLDVEKRFMLKDDFKDFREEYREDMRDIKTAIAGIARQS